MSSKRLLLIDGHSSAFRAYHALKHAGFRNDQQRQTGAVYGFFAMLAPMLREHKPTHICVAFDTAGPTFRKRAYPPYKEGRAKTPEELIDQIGLIQQMLTTLGITHLGVKGIEADDIVATLARDGEAQGMKVLVASGDRDLLQLVSPNVTALFPRGSMSNMARMTPQAVVERYGVTPERYPELAALVGEHADNLPGVPLVGDKTAAKWLNDYDGLDNLLANAGDIGGQRGRNLREHIEDVRRNRCLNRLLTDVELTVGAAQLGFAGLDRAAFDALCDELGFGGLRDRIVDALDQVGGVISAADANLEKKTDAGGVVLNPDAGELARWLEQAGRVGVQVNGHLTPGQADATLVAFGAGEEAVVIDLVSASEDTYRVLAATLKRGNNLVLCDAKAAAHGLAARGLTLGDGVADVSLSAYLLAPDASDYAVDTLARKYLTWDMGEQRAKRGEGDPYVADPTHAALRARAIFALDNLLSQRLEDAQRTLLKNLELPLQRVLTAMESRGIACSDARLSQLHDELSAQVEQVCAAARAQVGRPQLNLHSPKQLQEVLFDQLQMPPTRKIKSGYTTNAAALEQLYQRTSHPFLEKLLIHRDKGKLLQTVQGLARAVAPDGRIHTVLLQTGTATGRLSSRDPNLQNIPARTQAGLAIREAFVAGEGYTGLLTADYSQIEMRIMAHMSGDEALLQAITSGEDLHRSIAAMVFGIEPDRVSPEQRSRIKATSYGLAYGLSSFGLANQLGIPRREAQQLRAAYFKRFGRVASYLNGLVEQARQRGYTETLAGRRRYLTNLDSSSHPLRQLDERAALNAPIQGSAADIIKAAMISVERALAEDGLHSQLLLQIHDELVLEVAEGEQQRVGELVRHHMMGAARLDAPLEVSIGVGRNWREAAH